MQNNFNFIVCSNKLTYSILLYFRTLLRNLLKGYFNTPEGKRADVVHVIGGLLGFTPEEVHKVRIFQPDKIDNIYCIHFPQEVIDVYPWVL